MSFVTHSYGFSDSFVFLLRLVLMSSVTRSYVFCDSSIRDTKREKSRGKCAFKSRLFRRLIYIRNDPDAAFVMRKGGNAGGRKV